MTHPSSSLARLRPSVPGRSIAVGTVGLFVVLTAGVGCSSKPAPAPASSAQSTNAPVEAEGSPTSEATREAESTGPNPPLPSSTRSPSPSSAPSGEPSTASATEIRYVWPDETWEIEAEPATCDGAGGNASPYTDQPDYFMCGPTAASLLACGTDRDDGTVKCIQNVDEKVAARVDDPSVSNYSGPATQEPMPFRVGLGDDIVCSVVSHDHDQHWNGWYSWYSCTNGSELLVSDVDGSTKTFDRSDDTWTARVSRNKQRPEEQPVLWAEYAGQK